MLKLRNNLNKTFEKSINKELLQCSIDDNTYVNKKNDYTLLFLNYMVEPDWRKFLAEELKKSYMQKILTFLYQENKKGVTIFPPSHLIFNAFNLTQFKDIKVVLLGQDPYHNTGQAHGLCFSVPKGIIPPPSLKNIYKELSDEFTDFKEPNHGCLTSWAKQGIFMLNATLTVEAHKANSHSHIGWQTFTNSVIQHININSPRPIVFLLWGGFAQKKEEFINTKRHYIIKAAHPSPLSYNKFKGSRCFIRVNEVLEKIGHKPINWNSL